MITATNRRRFNRHEYRRMLAAGILRHDERLELLDGTIIHMPPIQAPHAAIVNPLNVLLTRLVGDTAIVSVQNPIQLNDYTEPQPDLTLLAPRADYYSTALALPDDVLLVIEVADLSLDYDRDEKLPHYAASGIAEVWIIDVAAQRIEQQSQPRAGQYRTKRTYEYDEQLTAMTVPQLRLRVSQIFG